MDKWNWCMIIFWKRSRNYHHQDMDASAFTCLPAVVAAFSTEYKGTFLDWPFSTLVDGIFDAWGNITCGISNLLETYPFGKLFDEYVFLSKKGIADTCALGVSERSPEDSIGVWKSKCATIRSIGLVFSSTFGIPVNLLNQSRNKKIAILDQS